MFIAILDEIAETSSEIASSVVEEIASSSAGESLPSAVQPVADWIKTVWEYLNQPLPIVGFSVIAILIFVWRFLMTTSVGKKTLKKLTTICEDTRDNATKTLEEYRKENEELKAEMAKQKEDVEKLRGALEIVCDNSRNKTVKALASDLGGKEDGEEE